MSDLKIGVIQDLKVLRETDIAYILVSGNEEVFLHKNESGERKLLPGETIKVFLYKDNRNRIAASVKPPLIQLDEGGFLEVRGTDYQYGAFLYNNQIKDLLLSKDDLPFDLDKWPKEGDMVFVVMTEKKGQLFARIPGRKQISSFFPEPEKMEPEQVTAAWVMYLLSEGMDLFTEKGEEIFVHNANMRQNYRIGEKVYPRILHVSSAGEYVGSLIARKEGMINPDSDIVMEYLNNHGGQANLGDKSDPADIMAALGMSKAAFKRAVGHLYKEGKINVFPDHTEIKTKK